MYLYLFEIEESSSYVIFCDIFIFLRLNLIQTSEPVYYAYETSFKSKNKSRTEVLFNS